MRDLLVVACECAIGLQCSLRAGVCSLEWTTGYHDRIAARSLASLIQVALHLMLIEIHALEIISAPFAVRSRIRIYPEKLFEF